MEKLTIKELQARCVAAGLKKTGKKQALINRLEGREFVSANNSVNENLLKRVADIEETLAQLHSRRDSDNDSILDTPCPNTDGFTPQMRSSSHDVINQTTCSVAISTTQPSSQFVPMHDHTSTMVSTAGQPVNSVAYKPYHGTTLASCIGQHVQPIIMSSGVLVPPVSSHYSPVITSTVPMMNSAPQMQPQTWVNNPMVAPTTMLQPPAYSQVGIPSIGVKDIVCVFPDFNPMSDGCLTSSQFVHRVQILKNAYQWRDDVLIFAVQQKLQGHAKLWVDSQRDVFISWPQFVQRFMQAFPLDENPAHAHIKMASIKREGNETPQAYYYKMLAIGTKYGLTESEIARHIINGINETDLKKKISNDYVMCSTLLHDIDIYCRHNELRYFVAKPRVYAPSSVSKQPHFKNNSTNQFKCFNCNKPGHMSVNCPEPQRLVRCGNCSKTTHKTNECPNTKLKSQVKQVNSSPQNHDLIKVVQINGREISAVVDCGSERTLMRESQASGLGIVQPCKISLRGFGGGKVECVNKLLAKIEVDGHTHEIDVLIVNDEWLSEAVLLGRDVLCCDGRRTIIENTECWIESAKNGANKAPHLSLVQHSQLECIIRQNRSAFAENVFELGTCNIKKMKI